MLLEIDDIIDMNSGIIDYDAPASYYDPPSEATDIRYEFQYDYRRCETLLQETFYDQVVDRDHLLSPLLSPLSTNASPSSSFSDFDTETFVASSRMGSEEFEGDLFPAPTISSDPYRNVHTSNSTLSSPPSYIRSLQCSFLLSPPPQPTCPSPETPIDPDHPLGIPSVWPSMQRSVDFVSPKVALYTSLDSNTLSLPYEKCRPSRPRPFSEAPMEDWVLPGLDRGKRTYAVPLRTVQRRKKVDSAIFGSASEIARLSGNPPMSSFRRLVAGLRAEIVVRPRPATTICALCQFLNPSDPKAELSDLRRHVKEHHCFRLTREFEENTLSPLQEVAFLAILAIQIYKPEADVWPEDLQVEAIDFLKETSSSIQVSSFPKLRDALAQYCDKKSNICNRCGRCFPRNNSLTRHKNKQHSGEKKNHDSSAGRDPRTPKLHPGTGERKRWSRLATNPSGAARTAALEFDDWTEDEPQTEMTSRRAKAASSTGAVRRPRNRRSGGEPYPG